MDYGIYCCYVLYGRWQGRLPYPTVWYGTNLVLLCDRGSSIQEEGDCAVLAIAGSPVQGGVSILQQGHTQTDTG